MEGKRRRTASFADTGGYGQISTTQKPFPRKNAHSRTLYNAWSLLLDAQSPCVVLLVVLGLFRCLWWNMGTKMGGSQLRVRSVGGFSRARTSHCQTSFLSRVIRRKETTVGTSLLSRLDAAVTPHLPHLDGQVLFPGVTHRVGSHGGLHGISSVLERYAG